MNNYFSLSFAILLSLLFSASHSYAQTSSKERFKPYIAATPIEGDLPSITQHVKDTLVSGGFTIAGEYSPFEGATVIAITNDTLKTIAAKTAFGGYGAVIRVGIRQLKDNIQVSYVNPVYMSHVYRMESLEEVSTQLASLIGNTSHFGSKKGLKAKALKKYHYMAFMPYFNDHDKLASFDSHEAALKMINANLIDNSNGLQKVFQVDLGEKEEVLFGVGISNGDGSDKTIMDKIDKNTLKHTAHLPYGLLVSGKNVYSLPGKFRIALAFPDLGMGDFMKISSAPKAIKASLKTLTKPSK